MMFQKYLASSEYIDWQHPLILQKAAELAANCATDEAIAKSCFEFVRDNIKHSWDFKIDIVTCKASDVLQHATGYCYAKSHLLAALLRANNIPSGLCYQRLKISDEPSYCLHGLNAAYLKEYGWYRFDPRGTKEGLVADFCPPQEVLPFSTHVQGEKLFAEVFSEPSLVIVNKLNACNTIAQVFENLPDAEAL